MIAKKRSPRFQVGEKFANFNHENYQLLCQVPERNNLCVYRRSNDLTDKFIAIEVVCNEGKKTHYPYDSEFGRRGWCYTGREVDAIKRVKEAFKLDF